MSENRLFWQGGVDLGVLLEGSDCEAIGRLHETRRAGLLRERWAALREYLLRLPFGSEIRQRRGGLSGDLAQGTVCIGGKEDLDDAERAALQGAIRELMPWRKGPFSLFDTPINAEWRSDFKWSRIAPYLDPLEGKIIADIGCGNGYYMLRAAASNPKLVLGIDPSEPFFFAFSLFQRFLENPALRFLMLGIEEMALFAPMFDVVLCMGVLYHRRDPLGALRAVRAAMKPGGQIIVESQAIPGDQPVALFAPERYAKARNVYFTPTMACLEAWLLRAGFVDVRPLSLVAVTPEEQRRTELAPFESLSDFLDPSDPSLTVEGFPAPLRAAVSARAPGARESSAKGSADRLAGEEPST